MRTIRIEIDGENGCQWCNCYSDGCCMPFDEHLEYNLNLQRFEPCQQCLDAEVKEVRDYLNEPIQNYEIEDSEYYKEVQDVK